MTDWVRLWHDMPTDPKWRTIARKSGQRVGDVMAVFNFIMVSASANAEDRGCLSGFDVEDVATALDLDEADVKAVMTAMQGKVLDGQRLTGWEKRQPKREDGTAAERKAAWKAREDAKRNTPERNGTHGNAPETDAETETDIPLVKTNGVDPEKLMFETGVTMLKAEGKSDQSARAILGKWKKAQGPGAVIEALGAAQRQGVVSIVPWVEARWRSIKQASTFEMSSPC